MVAQDKFTKEQEKDIPKGKKVKQRHHLGAARKENAVECLAGLTGNLFPRGVKKD